MQTINRHNYEEFFLLYVDNELNTSLRHAVEDFAKQNPDLAIELDMLMQVKVLPGEIMFADKEILLRTEGESIDETNHEEYFLLYIDNELSDAKRAEVEMYVLQHPALQDEFTTLKQSVLAPEAISYNNKETLYRKEVRRTVYFKSWQLAAAAIFIGACLTGWWMMQKPSGNIIVATVPSQVKQGPATTKPAETVSENVQQDNLQQTEQPAIEQQTIAQQPAPAVKKAKKAATTLAGKSSKKIVQVNDIAGNNKNKEEAPPLVIIPHPSITHNQFNDPKEPPVQTQDVADVQKDIAQKQNDVTGLGAPGKTENNAYKNYPVAYKEINTSDDESSLHVGMFDLNKTKVKTLFKKAGRMFSNKSTNLSDEDGKLQVANFEIDTKN